MRTFITKKTIQSLGILLSCLLLIHITACESDLYNTIQIETEDTVKTLTTPLTYEQSSSNNKLSIVEQSIIEKQRNGKRKRQEQVNTKNKENDNIQVKKGKSEKLSITSNQPMPAIISITTGKNININKRKGLEESSKEKETDSEVFKKPRINGVSIKQHNHNIQNNHVNNTYSTIDMQTLALLANNNDTNAQEEVLNLCMRGIMPPLLERLITPFSWDKIKEKAIQDGRYIYLLLQCSKQANDFDLYIDLIDHINAHAALGNPLLQTCLGYMYEKGIGVKLKHNKAVIWYKKAAEQGYAIAQQLLGDKHFANFVHVYNYRKLGYKTMKEYNEEIAIKLYKEAGDKGYIPAITNLGQLYQRADNWVYRCYDKAVELYKKAAAQGDIQAKFYLGETYYYGDKMGKNYKGVKQNYEEAFKWYKEAAEQGHSDAQEKLGFMYNRGDWINQDFVKAVEWYRKAAEGGSEDGQLDMGRMCREGRGMSKDIAQAAYWYMQAKNSFSLGHIFDRLQPQLYLTNIVFQSKINETEATLINSWHTLLSQGKQQQTKEYWEIYQQLKVILEQFSQWNCALNNKEELMITYPKFRRSEPDIANTIENHQKETGITPYVKQHTLNNIDYLSFTQENVEIAENIVNESKNKTLYNKVQELLKQLEKQNPNIKYQEQFVAFENYYNLFLTEIEQGQYMRNKKFKKKYPYFFE